MIGDEEEEAAALKGLDFVGGIEVEKKRDGFGVELFGVRNEAVGVYRERQIEVGIFVLVISCLGTR